MTDEEIKALPGHHHTADCQWFECRLGRERDEALAALEAARAELAALKAEPCAYCIEPISESRPLAGVVCQECVGGWGPTP